MEIEPKENKEQENEKLLNKENLNFPLNCLQCGTSICISSFDIKNEEYKISYSCQNGHKKEQQSLLSYYKNQIKNEEILNCVIHEGEDFIGYCFNCNINICTKCKAEHLSHQNSIKLFSEIIPEKEEINKFIENKNREFQQLSEIQNKTLKWLNLLKKKIEINFENQRCLIELQKNYAKYFYDTKLNINKIQTINFFINQIKYQRNPSEVLISNFNEIESNIINNISLRRIDDNEKEESIESTFKSNIIQNSDLDKLLNYFEKKPYKLQKIYTASENEGSVSSFHEKCDQKGPTLIIIKSDKNYIFGGYTEKQWGEKEGSVQIDNSAFLFSLNRNKKFKANEGEGICSYSSKGPSFYGNNDDTLIIGQNCLYNSSSFTSYYPNDFNSALLQSDTNTKLKENFIVVEYEVFQVFYK